MSQQTSTIISDNMFGRRAGQCVAVHFSGKQITSVGEITATEAETLSASAGTLDYRGKLLLPGLIDSHVHAIATGMYLLGERLNDCTSIEEIAAAIQRQRQASDRVVRLQGLDLSRLRESDHSVLSRAWFDSQAPDKPLIIKSVEGHSGWFNSLGWEMVVSNETLDRLGVSAEQRQEMYIAGRLHGSAYENHTTPIYDSYSHDERREGMRRVVRQAQLRGLTGIHCLEGYGDFRREDFSLILDLDRTEIDLTLYCRDATPKLAHDLGVTRFGGCWCVDGAIGSHSAALSEPYADRPGHHGELYFSDSELTNWIESGIAHDMQVCLHAIGDRALEQSLRCYEDIAQRNDIRHSRHRVDHFIIPEDNHGGRAARLGLCTSMQPSFDARWGGEDGYYAKRLGSQRALASNPVAQIVGCGMHVAGGSDSYITPLDPLGGIHAAMNHHNPAQRVDFDTAVKLFTEEAAYLAHMEGECGRIEPGLAASFTVVNSDRSLEDASVAATIWRGDVVYTADNA